MRHPAAVTAGIAGAALMLALIAGIALTGRWPVDAPRTHATERGILGVDPATVAAAEVATKDRVMVFERHAGAWNLAGHIVTSPAATHLATALRLLARAEPGRVLQAAEDDQAEMAGFGLAAPDLGVAVSRADGTIMRLRFGELTPSRNAQYVSLQGSGSVYLLNRDIGEEWLLAADMAERTAWTGEPKLVLAEGPLLPVSIERIWAIEIVTAGVMYRFERDPAGDWFHHVGQHVHTPGGFVHKADPEKAPLIAAVLGTLDTMPLQSVVFRHPDAGILTRFGLDHPPEILLLYSRDSAGPVARIELGAPVETGQARYGRIRDPDALVTVPGGAAEAIHHLELIAGGPS